MKELWDRKGRIDELSQHRRSCLEQKITKN